MRALRILLVSVVVIGIFAAATLGAREFVPYWIRNLVLLIAFGWALNDFTRNYRARRHTRQRT